MLLVGCSSGGGFSSSKISRPIGLLEKSQADVWVPAYISRSDRAKGVPRCLDLNNYWCIKAPSNSYWLGQNGRDRDGHARFIHPVYSARAFARVMRTYHYHHSLNTPREIISRYAPAYDCPSPTFYCPINRNLALSTANERVVRINGRDAIYRTEVPSGYRTGSRCQNPVFSCRNGYNPNWNYFDYISENIHVAWDQDIGLFSSDERFNRNRALVVFRAFAQFEISSDYLVTSDLILSAIQMEENDHFR